MGLFPYIPHDLGLEFIMVTLNRREDQEIQVCPIGIIFLKVIFLV